MVSTSNWPPLVAMSVVTFWRSTFSSRVTHLTVMSGFFAVKSLVSPCIRIMSPLLTVAMVSVVSANAGKAASRTAPHAMAPIWAAPNSLFIISSQVVVSICPCLEHTLTPGHPRSQWKFVAAVRDGPCQCRAPGSIQAAENLFGDVLRDGSGAAFGGRGVLRCEGDDEFQRCAGEGHVAGSPRCH